MRVSAITLNSQQPQQPQQPSFKASYVALVQKNLGDAIKTDVVDTFNSKILPQIKKTQVSEAAAVIATAGAGAVISAPQDLQDKVNFFALAGGSGSRFKELAQTVGDYNKISTPFRVDDKTDVHMLDFAMAMSKFFIGDNVEPKVAAQPSGSFGDVVKHYLAGNEIKDTVVCCGDNVFADSAQEMMPFFVRAINDPNKHLALVGVERRPDEVAERFGVLKVGRTDESDIFSLHGFEEKPKLPVAEAIAIDGKNIANTGLFYVSKEAMGKLVEELQAGVNNIKKNDAEPYDFAHAVKYIHSKTQDWFGIDSSKASDVKVVNKWEDVGEPKALYSFANEVRHGSFLENFPKDFANQIQNAFIKRVHLDAETPYILFTKSTDVSQDTIKNAKNIEGVNIVV